MSDNQEENSINKWLSGEISQESFEKENGKDTVIKYHQILSEIDEWIPENKTIKYVTPHHKEIKSTKVVKMARWTAVSVAASVALISFLGVWLLRTLDKVSHMTAYGETKEIVLPDGQSKIILAAFSNVSWQKSTWENDGRVIRLEGKAYFDVEPGSPFEVLTKTGDVEVLGTTFDVANYEKSLQVTCYTGKVKAVIDNDSERIVKGGESILFFEDQWEPKLTIHEEFPLWISDEIHFNNAPLAQVLNSISAEYELTFDKKNINLDRRFSGVIPKDDLESALNIAFIPLGIVFEKEGKEIRLSTK